jgi:TrpR-related protein YerC/YecD
MVGKIKYRNLSGTQKKEYLGDFYSIVSSLRGYDEAKNFFKDLLTTSEMVMICRRIQIAKLLMKGWTYEQVKEKLGAGMTTIGQVDKWLNEGFGGYARVLKRHNANKDKQREKIPPAPYSLEQVRRRYPAHFALLNLLMDKKKK